MTIQKPKMKYKGQWVYTTKEVSDMCESAVSNIYSHLAYNRTRLIEGKHYYRVTDDELRKLRSRYRDIMYKSGSGLILWTRYGLLRMCKMINTVKAWEVLEEIADCNMKEPWWCRVKTWIKERLH